MIDNELNKTKPGDCFERPNFIMANREIGIAYGGPSPLPEAGRLCRNMIAGVGLVTAVVGLVVAGAGRWLLLQD